MSLDQKSPPVRLAYSVDADDAFMFAALATGAIDLEGLRFDHLRADTASLNDLAVNEGADVVAVSLGVYPKLADRYLLLPHGASVGRGFGPVVVAKRPMTVAQLKGLRVGIPGSSTTAFLVLRLIQPDIVPVLVPISPFSRAFSALEDGSVDAVLLIHEGRLLYEQRGYHKVVELGEWWHAETSLPLPLGVNVIRKALGAAKVALVSRVLGNAIAWALSNRDALIAAIAKEDRGDKALTDAKLLDRYLGMYANEDTRHMAPDVRKAIDVLFGRARAAGLFVGNVAVDWAP
ncbi:MAG: MqnA/MqnD/SBP family protein [Deltaproteobacteria bacterium]|nr:MqnA/MqnD/SBP family protein [Deltaproteobacteria bacterium]